MAVRAGRVAGPGCWPVRPGGTRRRARAFVLGLLADLHARTAGRSPARSTTPRLPSTWPTPPVPGTGDRPRAVPAPSWIGDPVRCRAVGVPTPRAFATKPELARVMLERALDARVPAGWVTPIRSTAAARRCVAGWRPTSCPSCWPSAPRAAVPAVRAPMPRARPAEHIPPAGWPRSSAGRGAKGRRWYAWSRVALATADTPDGWGAGYWCVAA
jgi:hypothetical protein